MGKYVPVPVEEAKWIAEHFDKTMVVVICWDPVHLLTHTTTYGVSAWEKEQAAAAGALLVQTLGGDLRNKRTFEDFHKDYDSAHFVEAAEILTWIRNHHGTTPQMIQRIERWCKAALGNHTRQG